MLQAAEKMSYSTILKQFNEFRTILGFVLWKIYTALHIFRFRKERRRRILRPRRLIIASIIIMLIPLVNYFSISLSMKIHYSLPFYILEQLPLAGRIFLVMPVLIGLGLLMVWKWAWWSFLAYSALLILYNAFTIFYNPGAYNAGALITTAIFALAIIFFLRRDIAAPYFMTGRRGWRLQKRHTIAATVQIDGKQYQTADVSFSGFYINEFMVDTASIGQSFQAKFGFDSQNINAALVRIDSEGAGFAFRKPGRNFIEKLNNIIMEKDYAR